MFGGAWAAVGVVAALGVAATVAAAEAVLPAPPCGVTDFGHPDVAVVLGDAAARDEVVVPAPAPLVPPPGEVPVPAGVPLPSVPGLLGPFPPVSTFELTCTIAWRSGGTASVMTAMNATPASTPSGRSQLAPAWPAKSRRLAAGRIPPVPAWDSELSRGRCSGHAQWPRQTQCSARSRTPLAAATSRGCGGRCLVRARIRSSPLAPGSTRLTAADSARRSACSRSFSGAVIPSPASLPRHVVSCSKIDLSAAIARAVWLFTAPLLIPIVAAISASERSA